jgi:hypothetical protein
MFLLKTIKLKYLDFLDIVYKLSNTNLYQFAKFQTFTSNVIKI